MIAVYNKKWDIVKLLLRRGANAALLESNVCFKLQSEERDFLPN
jgi:hypothetical protein